jgi:hypothetical protein
MVPWMPLQLPHTAVDKLGDLEQALRSKLAEAAGVVTFKADGLVLGKFTDSGVDLTAQVGGRVGWRTRTDARGLLSRCCAGGMCSCHVQLTYGWRASGNSSPILPHDQNYLG